MRKLNAKQKQILRKTYIADNSIRYAKDVPDAVWDELVEINYFEILFQCVNNFLWELRFDRKMREKIEKEIKEKHYQK